MSIYEENRTIEEVLAELRKCLALESEVGSREVASYMVGFLLGQIANFDELEGQYPLLTDIADEASDHEICNWPHVIDDYPRSEQNRAAHFQQIKNMVDQLEQQVQRERETA